MTATSESIALMRDRIDMLEAKLRGLRLYARSNHERDTRAAAYNAERLTRNKDTLDMIITTAQLHAATERSGVWREVLTRLGEPPA